MINRSTDVKYAISRDKTDDKDLKAWLSDDSETSPLLLNIPQEIWSVVIPELHKKESIWDLIPENHKSTSSNIIDRVNNIRRFIEISGDINDTYKTYTSYVGDDNFQHYLQNTYMTDSDELPQ